MRAEHLACCCCSGRGRCVYVCVNCLCDSRLFETDCLYDLNATLSRYASRLALMGEPVCCIYCNRRETVVKPSCRVRTFAVLNARRPAVAKEKEAKVERRRPEWMPPPKVFPFIWITIGILRAVSTTMVSTVHSGLTHTRGSQSVFSNLLQTRQIIFSIAQKNSGISWQCVYGVVFFREVEPLRCAMTPTKELQ